MVKPAGMAGIPENQKKKTRKMEPCWGHWRWPQISVM